MIKKTSSSFLITNSLFPFLLATSYSLLTSCSIQKQITKSAENDLLETKALQAAHVGISIFEPEANKYWFNYQGDKYFVPASNVKIPTCYAAMKYLGDSITSIEYDSTGNFLSIWPYGDPTFLHPDFKRQPLVEFLKNNKKPIVVHVGRWQTTSLGSGWAWNDYLQYFMAERSIMPAYGNVVRFSFDKNRTKIAGESLLDSLTFIDSSNLRNTIIERSLGDNRFRIVKGEQTPPNITRTVNTYNGHIIKKVLSDLTGSEITLKFDSPVLTSSSSSIDRLKTYPVDSLLKPLMHRSDNFFAEQALLMVSNELIGVMNEMNIVDTLLKTDFKGLLQKPRWVDGSGLSRYNLFTPQSLIQILHKLNSEFGMARIREIFPTGNEGTLTGYFIADSSFIYAKTGTLWGVVALSGYLTTKKNKQLIFSVLVNDHQATIPDVRRAVEKFLQGVRNRY